MDFKVLVHTGILITDLYSDTLSLDFFNVFFTFHFPRHYVNSIVLVRIHLTMAYCQNS